MNDNGYHGRRDCSNSDGENDEGSYGDDDSDNVTLLEDLLEGFASAAFNSHTRDAEGDPRDMMPEALMMLGALLERQGSREPAELSELEEVSPEEEFYIERTRRKLGIPRRETIKFLVLRQDI
jgi:hypothetical protein